MISRFFRWVRGFIRGKEAAHPEPPPPPAGPLLHYLVGMRPLCGVYPGPGALCTVEKKHVSCPGCLRHMKTVALRRITSVR